MGLKDTNPKDAIGSGKVPLHLWPSTATAVGSIALLNGALKYGRSNWRAAGVRASIYHDAAKRHLDAWFEGEEVDPDDGVDHLGAVLACLAILVDARAAGKLNDDRAVQGGYRKTMQECTAEVARLKALHADKQPKHYSIEDNIGNRLNDAIIKAIEKNGWVANTEAKTPPVFGRVDARRTDGVVLKNIDATFLRWTKTNRDNDIAEWRYTDA